MDFPKLKVSFILLFGSIPTHPVIFLVIIEDVG